VLCRDHQKVMKNRLIYSNFQVVQICSQFIRCRIVIRPSFQASGKHLYAGILRLDGGEEPSLGCIQFWRFVLRYPTDVIPCFQPVTPACEFSADRCVVQCAWFSDTFLLQRVVPVVTIDEYYGAVSHDTPKKKPRRVVAQTPGEINATSPWGRTRI